MKEPEKKKTRMIQPSKTFECEEVISEEQGLECFRALHPAFQSCWEQAQEDFEEDAPRMVYILFSGKIREIFETNKKEDFLPLIRYVETLMRQGTEEMRGVIAVYFIESLLASGDFLPDQFATLFQAFGPLSRAYALRWNKFLGARNKGLEK